MQKYLLVILFSLFCNSLFAQDITPGRTLFSNTDGSNLTSPYQVKVALTDNEDGTITLNTASINGTPINVTSLIVVGNATIGDNITADFFLGNGSQLTGLPTYINYTDEKVDDRVSVLIQNNTYINWTYDDAGGTFTPTIAGLPTYINESTSITNTTTIGAIKTGTDFNISGLYTAGDALTLTGANLDFDGGASPGGELGGTWALPTIDSVHSGSAHHSAVTISGTPTYITLSGQDIVRGEVALTTDTSGSYVASVATTAPITGGAAGSEGATLTIAIPKATSSADGYLNMTDWSTFNNKGTSNLTGVTIKQANTTIGTQATVNFINGTGFAPTITNDTALGMVNVTFPNIVAGDMSYADSRMEVVTFTRDTSLASGTQNVATTIAKTPKGFIFIAGTNAASKASIGADDLTTKGCWFDRDTYGDDTDGITTSVSIYNVAGGNDYDGYVSAVTTQQFTITWTKAGSATGTMTIIALIFY